MLVTNDVHRSPTKENWISKKGFALITKRGSDSTPVTARHSVMQDTFGRSTMQSFPALEDIVEPYEMASLDPGFVRSTKNYLREANLMNVKRELKKEEEEALRCPDVVPDRDAALSSGLSFME